MELPLKIVELYLNKRLEIGAMGIGGSWKYAINDSKSDIDLFGYMESNLDDIERYIKKHASEGDTVLRRDFSIEHNFWYDGTFINIKIFEFRFIRNLLMTSSSLNNDELEEIENVATLVIAIDKEGFLSSSQELLRSKIINQNLLIRKAIDKYSSLLWRSFFQGLIRSEFLCWNLMISESIDYMLKVSFILKRVIPPPVKWRYHIKLIEQALCGHRIADVYRKFVSIANLDKAAMLDLYLDLKALDVSIRALCPFTIDFQWWKVAEPSRLKALHCDDLLVDEVNITYSGLWG
jgi:hypothetical protein